MKQHLLSLTSLTIVFVLLGGCAPADRRRAYQFAAAPARGNTLEAQRLNDEGLRFLEGGKLEDAEERFRDAVGSDLYYVPAHHNLGTVLLKRNKYYEAAWEFHYAAKLMPYASEPRANLGLLYESLGRLDRAIDEYEATLEIEPNNVATMRHLARAYVKAHRKDDRLKNLLEKLLGIPDNGPWDYWVRGQLIRLGRGEEGPSSLDD